MIQKTLLGIILIIFTLHNAEGQNVDSVLSTTENVRLEILGKKCFTGLENRVRLFAVESTGETPEIISLSPKKEYLDKESRESSFKKIDGENYKLLFKAIGTHELVVSLNGNIDTIGILVNPLPFVVQLGRHDLSKVVELGPGEFKAQSGLMARVKGFDMDAHLNVVSFDVIRIRRGESSKQITNRGGEFSGAAQKLIRSALPNDKFIFSEVRVLGPGQAVPIIDKGGQVSVIRPPR